VSASPGLGGGGYREAAPSVLVVAFRPNVIGVHPETGERLWQRVLEGAYNDPRIQMLPAHVLVLSSTLWCLALASGDVVWRAEVRGDTLLCDDRHAYVGGAGEAWGVRLLDGAVLWHDEYKGLGVADVALGVRGAVAQLDRSR
jgi:hypothetical protein